MFCFFVSFFFLFFVSFESFIGEERIFELFGWMFNSVSGLFCEKVSICSNENVRLIFFLNPQAARAETIYYFIGAIWSLFTAERKNMKQKKIARVKGAI